METNDTYNFYDKSRMIRIDHVDNINEFINPAHIRLRRMMSVRLISRWWMMRILTLKKRRRRRSLRLRPFPRSFLRPKGLPGFIKCRLPECWMRIISQILN